MREIPAVNVIIPVRDRRELVCRAVQSVLDQTVKADDILVIDDGSTDGSGDVVEQNFPGVRVIRSAPQGVSHARNLAIDDRRGDGATEADWFAFLDSDDQWHSQKLERQLGLVRQRPDARVVHCDEVWIRDGRRVNPMRKHAKPGGDIYRHCLPRCCMSPSATMIHRDVFESVGLFDESMPACEDYDLWLRIAARYPVHFIDEKLLTRYAGHDDQLSRRVPAQDRYRLRALEKMLDSDCLSADDWQATLNTFATKVEIYTGGAAKRGRHEEAEHWRRRASLYRLKRNAAAAPNACVDNLSTPLRVE